MAEIGHPERGSFLERLTERFHGWRLSKIATPEFQRWAAGFRLTRPLVRRDSARLYDLVSGFVYSQTLLACVELGVLEALRRGPLTARALGMKLGLPEDRMRMLCQAAASVGLLARRRGQSYRLGRLGAAAIGVPGLQDMILHHKVFYRDLDDPVALLRGQAEPELSRFWAYVGNGHGSNICPDLAATYSRLMATSQAIVAQETLDAVSLADATRLTDIGGGVGVFLEHVAERYPGLSLQLFDLPSVLDSAAARESVTSGRIALVPGSFLDDQWPDVGDAVTLIRVLYDHDDDTVHALLRRVHSALPSGGRLIISEPMSGGDAPSRAGDAYFGFYTMAMTTGRPRSPAEHMALLREIGFADVRAHRTRQPFLTGVVTARKPEE